MGGKVTRVAVIGAGKMGLPLACVFASRGAEVVACDADLGTVEAINGGICPFEEPGIGKLLAEQVAAGRLRATTDTRGGIAESQVCVVLVPVMLTEDRHADLSIIKSISADLAAGLQRGSMVSYETTLPVGTTRALGALIESGGLRAGVDFDVVFSPERVKSGFVLRHLFDNPKVVGGITPASAARGEAFYTEYLGAPVQNVGSLEAAELVKLAGMVYRDVNIALANELAGYAEAVQVDFESVRIAANTDGEAAILTPGIGVGGHCTPVYPYFMINEAGARGIRLPLTEAGRSINDQQPRRVLDRTGDLQGKSVLILGLGFRPGVKESAYSPAFSLREEICRRGGFPRLHDPMFSGEEITALGFVPAAVPGHQVVVLNTAHTEYAALDFSALARSGTEVVVDGRGLWHRSEVEGAGLRYVGIGKAPSRHSLT